MLKELGEKLEAAMRSTIVYLVLLMALAATSLAAYVVSATCWRLGCFLAKHLFNHQW
jgi:hypothetical protein